METIIIQNYIIKFRNWHSGLWSEARYAHRGFLYSADKMLRGSSCLDSLSSREAPSILPLYFLGHAGLVRTDFAGPWFHYTGSSLRFPAGLQSLGDWGLERAGEVWRRKRWHFPRGGARWGYCSEWMWWGVFSYWLPLVPKCAFSIHPQDSSLVPFRCFLCPWSTFLPSECFLCHLWLLNKYLVLCINCHCCSIAKSCETPCDPVDCSPPDTGTNESQLTVSYIIGNSIYKK